jgi:glycosyltransferase involved in cell wall biosynthesis
LSKRYAVPLRRFITVYNGVDTKHWISEYPQREREVARERLGIPADAHVILQVAVLRPEKGHQYSIEALAVLHRTTTLRPYLVFVGGGAMGVEDRLRDLARLMSVDGYAIFCGQHADVRPFYRIADLFTLSSVSETLSLAALEAMSSGLPCVLPDLGGAGEIIVEGGNGYVVPAGRPDLLAGAWYRALTGSLTWPAPRIREYVVSRFSLSACVKSYEDVLLS